MRRPRNRGPEHDVVGEKLRAPVEELGERLLAVRGVELVVLLHRHPRELAALVADLLSQLGVLGLEPRKLSASRLPFLAGSDLVVEHGSPHLAVSSVSTTASIASRLSPLYLWTDAPPDTHRSVVRAPRFLRHPRLFADPERESAERADRDQTISSKM